MNIAFWIAVGVAILGAFVTISIGNNNKKNKNNKR